MRNEPRKRLSGAEKRAVARTVAAAGKAAQHGGRAVLVIVLLPNGKTGLGVAGDTSEDMAELICMAQDHLRDWVGRMETSMPGALEPVDLGKADDDG